MKNYASLQNCRECLSLSCAILPQYSLSLFPRFYFSGYNVQHFKTARCIHPIGNVSSMFVRTMAVYTNWSFIPVSWMIYGHIQIHMAFIAVHHTSFDRYRTFFHSIRIVFLKHFEIIRLIRFFLLPHFVFLSSFPFCMFYYWNDSPSCSSLVNSVY